MLRVLNKKLLSTLLNTETETGQFRGINMSFYLFLLLLFTAETGQDVPSFTVGVGDEVTLPCGNVMKDQLSCDSSSWLFSPHPYVSAKQLLTPGTRGTEGVLDRLRVSADCSLVIKTVGPDDSGRYSCRPSDRDEDVYLSVADLSSVHSPDVLTHYCAVSRYGECWHSVQWLYEGTRYQVKTSPGTCSDRVSFKSPHQDFESLYCNVTDQRSGHSLLIKVSSKSSDIRPGNTSAERNQTSSEEDHTQRERQINQGVLRLLVVSVGLAVLILTVVTVNMWVRTKENRTQTEDAAEQDEDDEGSAVYESIDAHVAAVRLQRATTP